MYEFTSTGSYEIKNKGTVYIVTCPEYVPDRRNDPWTGTVVKLDGKEVLVSAVESFALGHIKKNAEIGLLVKPTR